MISLFLAFAVFRPPSAPGPIERDFEAYYAAGVTFDVGRDPYSRAIWATEREIPGVTATREEVLPFVGPAASLPVWAALGRLPYRLALAVWTAVLIIAYVIVIGCALRLARAPRDPLVYAIVAATAFAAAPMLSDFALGQSALVAAAGIAVACLAYRRRSPVVAFVATLVAGSFQPNLAPALVARMRSRWDLAVAGTAGLAFGAIGLMSAGGVQGIVMYARRLRAHGEAERFVTIQHTPAAIAYSFGFAPPVAVAIGGAVAILAIVWSIALIRRERLTPTTATLLCCAALPLAIPFFHEHDFVLVVLPILVLALRARGRARAATAVAAVLILVDWFGLAQRHAAQGQILALGAAVAFGVLGLAGDDRRPRWDMAGIVSLAILAAIAVPLGRSHPAPIWPDTLPARYTADPHADMAGVWADEQRAAGLGAVDPIWGILRAFPLAGCVLLGYALIADARDGKRGLSRTASGRANQPLVANLVAVSPARIQS